MINGFTLCTDKTAHYVWLVQRQCNGDISFKKVFCAIFFLFPKNSTVVLEKSAIFAEIWIIVSKCTLEKFTAWGCGVSVKVVKSQSGLQNYSTNAMFSVHFSHPHIKWQKLISDLRSKKVHDIFYFVCVFQSMVWHFPNVW